MTQSEPKVIDGGDMPRLADQSAREPSNFVADLIETVTTPTDTTPETPEGMYRHLLSKAHAAAVISSEAAYTACDWFALFDKASADRYRKSARSLFDLSEHLLTLIEDS